MIQRAFLLCAGLGKRMRPITETTPKPLVPVWGKPMVHYNIQALYNYGIRHFIFNSHYLANEIDFYVRKYWGHKCECHVIFEPDILETGGGVKNALHLLGNDPFFALNGDIFWQGDATLLPRMAEKYTQYNAPILGVAPLPQIIGHEGVGDFTINTQGQLQRAKNAESMLFMGVQILQANYFKNIPQTQFSLNILYDQYIAQNQLYGEKLRGQLYHIGTPETHALVQKMN